MNINTISPAEIARNVTAAVAEDVGSGDVTAALVPADAVAAARVIVREPAILCGTAWFDAVFESLVPDAVVEWDASDGDALTAEQRVCRVTGPARGILTAERCALNFLQTLSGTATTTARYVALVAGTDCRVLDTRKTLPGLRLAQKYAVSCGGGNNHRIGLFDAVLIKENHIMAAGSIGAAVRTSHALHPALPVEVEVETLAQVREALDAGADRLLLDNFERETLREAVAINQAAGASRAELEASGGLTDGDIGDVAATGVDFISVGALTKHVRATDYSMRFVFS